MSKSKLVDIIIIVLIGIFISTGVYRHFFADSILSVNFYCGCIFWLMTVLYQFTGKGKYLVFFLLILLTFNIFVCSATITTFGPFHYLYKEGDVLIGSPGVNPICFLIAIIYCVVNFNVVKALFSPTEEEALKQSTASIKFYYDKFNAYSSDELTDIFKIYKEYPLEAQAALKKIHQERNLVYLDI